MWLSILALADKIFGILGTLLGWWKERSDESQKIRREQQAIMDEAAKKGDFDAWKTARNKRNRG